MDVSTAKMLTIALLYVIICIQKVTRPDQEEGLWTAMKTSLVIWLLLVLIQLLASFNNGVVAVLFHTCRASASERAKARIIENTKLQWTPSVETNVKKKTGENVQGSTWPAANVIVLIHTLQATHIFQNLSPKHESVLFTSHRFTRRFWI